MGAFPWEPRGQRAPSRRGEVAGCLLAGTGGGRYTRLGFWATWDAQAIASGPRERPSVARLADRHPCSLASTPPSWEAWCRGCQALPQPPGRGWPGNFSFKELFISCQRIHAVFIQLFLRRAGLWVYAAFRCTGPMTEGVTWLRTNSFTLPRARLELFKTRTFPFVPFMGLLLRWLAGSSCRRCGAPANAVIRHQMGVTGGTAVGAAARAASALSGGPFPVAEPLGTARLRAPQSR